MRLKESADLRQRLRADELVDDASTAKQLHGRNAANLELPREVGVFLGVHLDDLDLAGMLIGDFRHAVLAEALMLARLNAEGLGA